MQPQTATVSGRDYSVLSIFDDMTPEQIADWFRALRAEAHAEAMKVIERRRQLGGGTLRRR